MLTLIDEMEKAFAHIATFNYPIATDTLPAKPVDVFCSSLISQEIISSGWWGGFINSISSIFGHLSDKQKSIMQAVRNAMLPLFASYDLVGNK